MESQRRRYKAGRPFGRPVAHKRQMRSTRWCVSRGGFFVYRPPVMKIMSNSIPSAPTLPNAFWVKIAFGVTELQNQNTDNTVEDHSDIILFSVRRNHGFEGARRYPRQTDTSTTLFDTASTTAYKHIKTHIGHNSPTECAWCWFRAREG